MFGLSTSAHLVIAWRLDGVWGQQRRLSRVQLPALHWDVNVGYRSQQRVPGTASMVVFIQLSWALVSGTACHAPGDSMYIQVWIALAAVEYWMPCECMLVCSTCFVRGSVLLESFDSSHWFDQCCNCCCMGVLIPCCSRLFCLPASAHFVSQQAKYLSLLCAP